MLTHLRQFHRELIDEGFQLNKGVVAFFVILHTLAFVAWPVYVWYYGVSTFELVYILGTFLAGGFATTAYYHRLVCHGAARSIHPLTHVLFFVPALLALQNSAFKWAGAHIVHHKCPDEAVDPYSVTRGPTRAWGIFWAHMMWIVYDTPYQHVYDAAVPNHVLKSRILMFQHRFYGVLTFAANVLLPLGVGYLTAGLTGALGLFLANALRVCVVEHIVFSVNSFTHEREAVNPQGTAVNRWWWCGPLGEGNNHRHHHNHPTDYRNGIHWYDLDPSRWLLLAMNWLGLVKGLNRTPQAQIEKAEAQYRMACMQEGVEPHVWKKVAPQLDEKLSHVVASWKEFERTRRRYLADRAEMKQAVKDKVAGARLRLDEAKLRLKETRIQVFKAQQEWGLALATARVQLAYLTLNQSGLVS